VRAASVAGAVGEIGGKAAPPVQLPAQRGVVDAKRASDDLPVRLVEARYGTGDRGGRLHERFGAHSEVGTGKTTLAAEVTIRVLDRERGRVLVSLIGTPTLESLLGAVISAIRREQQLLRVVIGHLG